MGPPFYEFIGPDVVRPLRAQADAGPVIQPKPSPPGLPIRHLQPLLPPEPSAPEAVPRTHSTRFTFTIQPAAQSSAVIRR